MCFRDKSMFPSSDYALIVSNGKIFKYKYDEFTRFNNFIVMKKLSKIKNIPCCIHKISFSFGHMIILLSDGTIMSRGYNCSGQLGYADISHQQSFRKIENIRGSISDISCGRRHTVILLSDGRILGCGSNEYGQLGNNGVAFGGKLDEIRHVPHNISQVVCGYFTTYIRLTDGSIFCSGNNVSGQLGNGSKNNATVFKKIRHIPCNISQIASGNSHTMILLTDGRLLGCGCNLHGQLGLGDTKDRTIFEEIIVPRNISQVTCGSNHTFILLRNGKIMSCGNNTWKQLAHGDTKNRTLFEEVTTIQEDVSEVVCSGIKTLIRLHSGKILSC